MSRLFDPLGLISPLIIRAKVYFQELWILKLPWDDSLPMDLHHKWEELIRELLVVNQLRIPRHVILNEGQVIIDLHGFSDASLRAYGCCLYSRCEDQDGNVTVHLIAAKSRVAPAKVVKTLPCLELCGAELLSQLQQRVTKCLKVEIRRKYLWTDSKIVLGWLRSHASTWKTFVCNRVSSIQQLTKDSEWRYVPSKQNPADLVSRGITLNEIKDSIWFKGPSFLLHAEESWPKENTLLITLPDERKSRTVLLGQLQQSLLEYIYKYSNFRKICRIVAYILKFINKCRSYQVSRKACITTVEFELSLLKIIWMIQQSEFKEEIITIKGKGALNHRSHLLNLNPFIDDSDLLRVGGRLQNANLPYDAKAPILLPKKNQFIRSYVHYLHVKHLHAGPQALVAIIRQRFWIINCRDYCRKIVNNCIHCFRYKPKLLTQIMGNLPSERLVGCVPFATVGVDFCGPIMITQRIRGKAAVKAYIAVFICFLTKGIHLEVVSDLTSEAFIAALKRFIARRTLCKHLFCDNATNFVGARHKLKELRELFINQQTQNDITKWCTEQKIEFHHIPPRSPHFGGIWESAVKLAKHYLYKTLYNSILNFEELSTLCCQIEAILNSRPITQVTNDPNDETVLTPAHFWCQAPLEPIIEPETLERHTAMSYINRWRYITMLQQHFWRRWSTEYLLSLHKRHKWKTVSPNLLKGQLVIIQEDHLPPQKWLLGRVIETYQGTDGRIRVAEIKTRTGVLRRAIHRLACLPMQEVDNLTELSRGEDVETRKLATSKNLT